MASLVDRAKRLWSWFEGTLAWRAWTRFGDLRGNRLAAAVTFFGFVSLFPLLVIGAVIMSAVFGQDGVDTMQDLINENLPGFGTGSGAEANGAAIDVQVFYDSSGTIGIIGTVTLIVTGLGWVDATRAAVRSMWRLDDEPGNVVTRRLADVGALVGLGVLILLSSAASAVLGQFTSTLLDAVGIDGAAGRWTLRIVAFVLAVGVSMLLFAYLLSGLPRIRAPWRELLWVSLLGGVAFELLKQFLFGFVAGPASRNAYAAFATPLALLAWIYVLTRVLMVLAALMAQVAEDNAVADELPPDETIPESPTAPRELVQARQARAVGFIAGGVLGLLTLSAASAARRAGRAVVGAVRDRDDD